MKKVLILIYFLVFSLLLNSCAILLAPGSQNIKFDNSNKNASIYVNKKIVNNKDGVLSMKLKKESHFHQIIFKEAGYKDEYKALGLYKHNFLKYVSIIPFSALFFIPPLIDFGLRRPRTFDYVRTPIKIPENRTKIVVRNSNQKYIYLSKFDIDIPKEKIKTITRSYSSYLSNSAVREEEKKLETKDYLKPITDSLNKILVHNNFIDTTNTLLKGSLNTLKLEMSIKSIKETKVINNSGAMETHNGKGYVYFDYFDVLDLDLVLELKDVYGQTKYKYDSKIKSGEYEYPYYITHPISVPCLLDGVQKSIYELLSQDEVQNLLKYEKDNQEKNEVLKIKLPSSKITSLENAINASVTVITDKGHGSGFAITQDGYIITNFHVVADAKTIDIQTNAGEKIKAKLVRKNDFGDLALLKVEKEFQYAFSIPNSLNFNIGDEIYAIGTPKTIEFGQSLTKGIISGKRNKESQEIIQTDVSVNSGNSGGSLVNKQGELVGVVNAKVKGIGVEGIAFAIIAKDILTYLDLSY